MINLNDPMEKNMKESDFKEKEMEMGFVIMQREDIKKVFGKLVLS